MITRNYKRVARFSSLTIWCGAVKMISRAPAMKSNLSLATSRSWQMKATAMAFYCLKVMMISIAVTRIQPMRSWTSLQKFPVNSRKDSCKNRRLNHKMTSRNWPLKIENYKICNNKKPENYSLCITMSKSKNEGKPKRKAILKI